jgi:hypothetical protein
MRNLGGKQKMKSVFFFLLLASCQTCLKEDDIGVLLNSDPFTNLEASNFNGVYVAKKFSLFGKEVSNPCKTIIRDGKIRTQNLDTIHIRNLEFFGTFGGEEVYDFRDRDVDYRIYQREDGLDLVSINLWLTLEKGEKK